MWRSGRFRRTAKVPADVTAILAKPANKRTPAEVAKLTAFARDARAGPDDASAPRVAGGNVAAKAAFEKTLPHVLVTISGSPRTVRILARGATGMDTSGEGDAAEHAGLLATAAAAAGRARSGIHATRPRAVDGRGGQPAHGPRRRQPRCGSCSSATASRARSKSPACRANSRRTRRYSTGSRVNSKNLTPRPPSLRKKGETE